ncbi:helix-turn-helix transcriptional regulator [Arthrobacter sp. ok362]|uniref:helix-turn-helix domain-containing protein n=1 Tax=Arthrobacter sp. ok362 TaxID=1761745 RepID=UPI0008873D78|nr:helix-turn-helix transcriptional regulator [Arthrobacter sp. ok362]SDK81218.1 Cro/C1-type HTH DNA-binding domain-containing protein [Arthrobacter sp. ok362]
MSMPSGKQPESGKFARAVTDEILMSMARKRISGAQLASETSRSQSYISKRLRNEVAFTVNDIEEICDALGEDLLDLVAAAVRAAGLTRNYRRR